MVRDNFQYRKKDVLDKIDKSNIGSWDERIVGLCEKFNSMKDYYSTSSCSGRIALNIDNPKKASGMFVKVWHDEISFNELKEILEGIKKGSLLFKQEPCILHVACRNLKDAGELVDKAQKLGWKRSGIISINENKGNVIELMATEKLEFPIIQDGKLLVDDEFLKVIVERANSNLRKVWGKIEKLEELI